MNVRDSEFDQLLADWLEDDPFVAPAVPVEAAIDFARAHPRRRDWLAFLRRDAMTTRATTGLRPVAILLAVVAVLLAAVGGAVIIGSAPDATPVPSPSATAIPTSTPVAVRPLPPDGALSPGQYRTGVPDSPVTVAMTIGGGWSSGGWYIMNPPELTHQVSFWTVGDVNSDACDWGGTLPRRSIGPTVDDLVSALDAQSNTNMSTPADVVIDGYAGKRVRMSTPHKIDCSGIDSLVMWVDPAGNPGRGLEPTGTYDTLWILDVDGHRVVIDTSTDLSKDARAEVSDVMNSIQFEVN
jgi:hypothetical protein